MMGKHYATGPHRSRIISGVIFVRARNGSTLSYGAGLRLPPGARLPELPAQMDVFLQEGPPWIFPRSGHSVDAHFRVGLKVGNKRRYHVPVEQLAFQIGLGVNYRGEAVQDLHVLVTDKQLFELRALDLLQKQILIPGVDVHGQKG